MNYKELYNKLNLSEKIYITISIIVLIIYIINLKILFNNPSLSILLVLALFIALLKDFTKAYKQIIDTTFGKWVIYLIVAFSSNIGLATASQLVNYSSGLNPANLTYTVAFVSLMLIPLFIFFAIYFLYLITLTFSPFYILFILIRDTIISKLYNKEHQDKLNKLKMIISLLRIFAIAIVAGFFIGLKPIFELYINNILPSITKKFIYHFEAYSNTKCFKEENQKVIFLNNHSIVLITKINDHYKFNEVTCKTSNKTLERNSLP